MQPKTRLLWTPLQRRESAHGEQYKRTIQETVRHERCEDGCWGARKIRYVRFHHNRDHDQHHHHPKPQQKLKQSQLCKDIRTPPWISFVGVTYTLEINELSVRSRNVWTDEFRRKVHLKSQITGTYANEQPIACVCASVIGAIASRLMYTRVGGRATRGSLLVCKLRH